MSTFSLIFTSVEAVYLEDSSLCLQFRGRTPGRFDPCGATIVDFLMEVESTVTPLLSRAKVRVAVASATGICFPDELEKVQVVACMWVDCGELLGDYIVYWHLYASIRLLY